MRLAAPARVALAAAVLLHVGFASASQPGSYAFGPPAAAAPVQAAAIAQATEPEPPASEVTPDPWPKSATVDGTRFTLYQPQLDRWDDYNYEAHAAVQVIPSGSKDPVFGVIEITAYTLVDRPNRVVYVEGLTIAKATFPSAPGK